MTATTKTRTKKSCGQCGSNAPCRCCQPVCESFADDAACKKSGFARPRFFAGQLLTEEDLQDLTGYMLAKNRLHNRHLIGAGVVCGLDVEKHACNPRQVNVGPGYALDCCGNDISVPCLVEGLDIIAMIQDLRAGLRGGYDCGDPCRPTKDNADKPNDAAKAPARPQLYDLYIRYCERNIDPVAPYQFDSCDAPGCQPSRVEEGFTFELRCAPVECVAGAKPNEKKYVEAAAKGSPTLPSQLEACLGSDQHKYLARDTFAALHQLETAHKAIFQGSSVREVDLPKLKKMIDENLVSAERQLASAATSADSLRIVHRGIVWAVRGKIRDAAWTPGVANSLAELMKKLKELAGDSSTVKADAKEVLAMWERHAAPPATPDADRAFNENSAMAGELINLKAVNTSLKTLNEIRGQIGRLHADGLLELDDNQKRFLRDHEFKAIGATADLAQIADRREQALRLGHIVFTNLQRCFCDSLAPPCLPCDDPAVLLARIEVDMEECRIIHVCDLQRTIAWTGTAMSYWLSGLRRWLNIFRGLCCIPYEKRQQPLDLQAALKTEATFQWQSDSLSVATWRSVPAAEKPLDMMKELTRQVHLIARVDAEGLSEALDPFGSRTDPTPALDALRAEIERLKDQIRAIKAPATPPRPTVSLRDEWNVYATEVITKKKAFLKAEFHKRLTSEGIKVAEAGSRDEKNLKEVKGAQVRSLKDVPGRESATWASIDIPTLVANEAKLVKGIKITEEIEKFWRDVHELDHLIFYWPEQKIEEGELTASDQ